MNILFIYPPSVYLNHSMFKHFTYFSETVNLVANSGYDVSVLDCGVELFDRRTIYRQIKQSDVIVFIIEPYTINNTLSLSVIAKQLNSRCKIILYGTAAALIPNYLSHITEIDYVVADGFFFEGISTALNMIRGVCSVSDSTNRDSQSKIIFGSLFDKGKKWGNPISDLVPINKYQEYGNRMFEFTVQTGCPYNCSFCSEKILFKSGKKRCFIQRPVDDIISVLSEAAPLFSSVYFSATTFTYDRDWVISICEGMIREKIKLPWRSDTRIDCLDKELIETMKKSGLKQLSIGIEAFEDSLLQTVNKGVSSGVMEETISLCQRSGVSIKALLILGIPGQTADDIHHTQEVVKKLGIPYRWKEYSPIRELFEADRRGDSIEDKLSAFDRSGFNASSVEGINPEEYMSLLFPDNYYR